MGVGERGFWMSGQKRVVSKQKQTPAVKLIQVMKLIIEKTISRLLYPGPISYLSRDNFFVDPTERFKSYYWQSTLHTLLYNTILVCELEDPRQESCSLVTDAEHKSCLPVKRKTILTCYVTNVRAIFVWHFNENARTKQKRQTNGNLIGLSKGYKRAWHLVG